MALPLYCRRFVGGIAYYGGKIGEGGVAVDWDLRIH